MTKGGKRSRYLAEFKPKGFSTLSDQDRLWAFETRQERQEKMDEVNAKGNHGFMRVRCVKLSDIGRRYHLSSQYTERHRGNSELSKDLTCFGNQYEVYAPWAPSKSKK